MAQLNDFISQIKTEGLMRNNRYAVDFSLPTGLANPGIDLRKVLLFCDNVTIPGVTMSSTPARTYGEVREMPYEKLFSPITMSFYVDSSMQVKKLFDSWQGIIQDPDSRNIGYYDDYRTDITITMFDVNNNAKYSVIAFESYVKDISAIQLDYSNRDVMKLNVTMGYKYWKSSEQQSSVSTPDNKGFFDKIGEFIGDAIPVPSQYYNDFDGFQKEYNNYVPQLGGLNLAGATFNF